MRIQPYLIVGSRGSVRIVKTAPSLEWNEVAVRLILDIPDALFQKPRIEASISIPEDAVQPPVIDAKVLDTVAASLKEQTGFEVHVSVDGLEGEDNE